MDWPAYGYRNCAAPRALVSARFCLSACRLLQRTSLMEEGQDKPSQASAYYCRGCGGLLPERSSVRFHPECLKADKRRRVAELRQREAQRFRTWFSRQHCPECGAKLEKLANAGPPRPVVRACETSQGVEAAANSSGST